MGKCHLAEDLSPEQVREKYLATFPGDVGKLAYWLWNDIANMHLNWNYFIRLFATDEASIDLMNSVAPSFFSMMDRILRSDNLLRICRLSDPSFSDPAETKENASLPRLVDKVQGLLPEGDLKHSTGLLSQLKVQSKPIRDLRNKRLAHSDFDEVLRLRDEPLPGITMTQVEEVMGTIRDIFSLVEGHFLGSETMFTAITSQQPPTTILLALRRFQQYDEIERLVLENHFGISRQDK